MIPLAKVKKKCRICGKEYTPCSYCENDKMAFHYRTICCSRECAVVYFARVQEARGKKVENTQTVEQSQAEIEARSNDVNSDLNQQMTEKPKRRYVKKKQVIEDSEDSEQIENSEGTLN